MTDYEKLRAAATGAATERDPRDLFVLQRDGMAAWLQGPPSIQPIPERSEPFSPPLSEGRPLPPPTPRIHDELVQLLADLVLRDLPGGPAHDP